jgi:hypothetical protein
MKTTMKTTMKTSREALSAGWASYVILSHVLHTHVHSWYCGYAYSRLPSIAHSIVLHVRPKNKYCVCIHGYLCLHATPGHSSRV